MMVKTTHIISLQLCLTWSVEGSYILMFTELLYLTKIQTLSAVHICLRSELTDTCQNSSQYCTYNQLYIAIKAVQLLKMYQLSIKNIIFSLLIMYTRIKSLSTYMQSHVMPLNMTSQIVNTFIFTAQIHIILA